MLSHANLGFWYTAAYASGVLDATHFFVSYPDTTNSSKLTGVVCSISGTTVTAGTPVVLSSSTDSVVNGCALDATHFVSIYFDTTNNSYMTAVVCSVSGTTITVGTPVVLSHTQTSSTSLQSPVVALSATQFVALFKDDTNTNALTAVACTVAGTTITAGTPTLLVVTDADFGSAAVALDAHHFAFVATYTHSAFNAYPSVCSVS